MGPNPNGPCSVSCDGAIRYSGFFGVRETWVLWVRFLGFFWGSKGFPGIPTTIETMGVNITTIVYLRVLIIQIESTIILMVVEA